MNKNADKVYINGKIYTVDNDFFIAEAFAIRDDRFISVGDKKEVEKYIGENTEIIDLEGKFVYPGFIESHLHVNFLGIGKMQIDAHMKSKEEIIEMVAKEYAECKPGNWIIGDGWNNEYWEDSSFPTRHELDKVAPDIPVYIKRVCAHASWVNSEAMKLAGIDKDTPNPPGGEFLRDADGVPTGMVTDQAQEYFLKIMPELSEEKYEKAALLAQDVFFENGFTTIHDAGSSEKTIKRWESMYERGILKIRKNIMFRVEGRPSYEELMKVASDYFKTGLKIGKYGNRMTVRSFKISSDGSMGARSAWLLEDYSDRPGHRGNRKFTDEQMYNALKLAFEHGFQPVIHCIGDACVKQCLDALEKIKDEMPLNDHRMRIEHSQVVREVDIPRYVKLGVIPSFQPIAIMADKLVAEERFGKERMEFAYAWRKFIDAGCKIVPISSDAPIDPINPFANMYAAVTRKDMEGKPECGWYVINAMTREEALKGTTIMGAKAAFEENIKGSIEKGKLADFVIADGDYIECEQDRIKDIQVLETVLGGETVYKR